MSIYDTIGARTIINAKGTSTRVSGALLAPEVTAAMREAAEYCVDMAEIQAAASRIIAEATGAEAGIVTSGAAAGLLLGTAACVAGLDPARMARLPDTSGMKNEVVMVRSQRNQYDHAVRSAGVHIVEAGLPDRVAGAGVRDAEAWEIGAAVTERTAAIVYVANANARPTIEEVARVANSKHVPLLVDAAAQLPPAANLRRFIAAGADLVAYSGGKAIGGPQGSGILCGGRDLIMSAVLQQLDLDIAWEQWSPPAALIDKSRLVGLPPHGIGRQCKVGKETIVGLLVALRRFLAEDEQARNDRLLALVKRIESATGSLRNAKTEVRSGTTPRLILTLDRDFKMTGMDVCIALQNGTPPIHVDPSQAAAGVIGFSPVCLRPEDPDAIGRRLRELIG
ncbi:MAG: aminotransferase class V-fold PLP-dependent enzyme [Bryobacteraceae bacterium]|nr:aminotransferase class V-fold PLP-dependent enzyme [Bryobacteraceae bacterium]